MFLCVICLRTDIQIKLVSNMLAQFHDQLCCFSDVTMRIPCYCCWECEYLLSKFHKFKAKCIKAKRIYTMWLKTNDSKKLQLNRLSSLLPPATLGMWAPNPDKIGDFTIQADLNAPIKETKAEVKSDDDEIESDCDMKDTLSPFLNTDDESVPSPETEQIVETTEYITETEELSSNIQKHVEETSDGEVKAETEQLQKQTKQGLGVKKKTRQVSLTSRVKITDKVKESDKQYESVFDIEYLTTYKMKEDEFERRKSYQCYVSADFKCEICYTGFKNLKLLEYHNRKWHKEEPDKVCCRICNKWVSNKAMYKHKVHHAAVFKCKLCPLVSYQRASMENHYEWHNGKLFHCEECDVTYKSISSYRTHLGKAHRHTMNVCDACGRGFNTPQGLSFHQKCSTYCTVLRVTSEATEGVRCERCDITLPSKEVYKVHMSDVHLVRRRTPAGAGPGRGPGSGPGRRPGTGPGGSRGTDAAGLPIVITSRAKPVATRKNRIQKRPTLTCRLCNQVGTCFPWLKLHFKTDHPDDDYAVVYADKRSHLCDVCGLGFTSVYALRNHRFIHTGERPFPCDLCPKRFRTPLLMRAHRLRHLPSTLACEHCGKQFKSESNLYNHVKIHTGEKIHKCGLCGKAFLLSARLNEHMRGVHLNIRRSKPRKREGATVQLSKKQKVKIIKEESDSYSGDSTSTEL